MTLFICLDKNNGISFNNRRQSRDIAVVSRMCERAKNSILHISENSSSLFAPLPPILSIDNNPLEKTKSGEFCFVESIENYELINKVKKIIVYRWDKVYPHDESFKFDFNNFTLESLCEFSGKSHNKITEEVYVK